MNDQGESRLNLFFFTVGGVHFAADVEQASVMTPYSGEDAEDLFWFHEEFGFGTSITYHTPIIVTIRTRDAQSYRVIIDMMDEIAEFSCNDIRPFPELIEPMALRNGMWAILPRNGSLILLVDFQWLFQLKHLALC